MISLDLGTAAAVVIVAATLAAILWFAARRLVLPAHLPVRRTPVIRLDPEGRLEEVVPDDEAGAR